MKGDLQQRIEKQLEILHELFEEGIDRYLQGETYRYPPRIEHLAFW